MYPNGFSHPCYPEKFASYCVCVCVCVCIYIKLYLLKKMNKVKNLEVEDVFSREPRKIQVICLSIICPSSDECRFFLELCEDLRLG